MSFIFPICFCCLIYLCKSWIQKTNKGISRAARCRRRGAALPAGCWAEVQGDARRTAGWLTTRRPEWPAGVRASASSCRSLRTEDRVANSTFSAVGSSALALASFILSAFTPHNTIGSPPLSSATAPHPTPFFFLGGLEFIPDNPAQFRKWNERDSVKCGIMDGLPRGEIASLLSDLSEGDWVL